MPTKRKLKYEFCEICGFDFKSAIHVHHIIPRTDPKCTDAESNYAYLCDNCHNQVHALELIIEGRYLTTEGQKLFWHKKGEKYHIIPGVILNADGTATIQKE